jgi:cystathionine beta-lyase
MSASTSSSEYDFDRPVDRRGTASLKWDFDERLTGVRHLLPLWIADMDFKAPTEVIQALSRRVEHGVFGYTLEPESYYQAIIDWMKRRHDWEIRRGWMISCPGVVPSIGLALRAYSSPGDRVIIQPPVYYPFREAILNNGRRVAENPLQLRGGRYRMDFDQLAQLIDNRTRMLILCSPHNPVGRVWSRVELEKLVDICAHHDLVIVSDEIHHDLVMKGFRHLPTAGLSEQAGRITITLTAATKTFNLAGLGCSMAVITNPRLRRRFKTAWKSQWTGAANALSAAATEAAYRYGERWLEQVLAYIRQNYDFLVRFLGRQVPQARVTPLEGTYLAWVDLRALGLSAETLKERILKTGRVWLDEGPKFGTGGEGFQRLNLACPRSTLAEALERIAAALG